MRGSVVLEPTKDKAVESSPKKAGNKKGEELYPFKLSEANAGSIMHMVRKNDVY